jgi:hypothetical protein
MAQTLIVGARSTLVTTGSRAIARPTPSEGSSSRRAHRDQRGAALVARVACRAAIEHVEARCPSARRRRPATSRRRRPGSRCSIAIFFSRELAEQLVMRASIAASSPGQYAIVSAVG